MFGALAKLTQKIPNVSANQFKNALSG